MVRLRLTRRQAHRCYGLLRSAGDVWAWLLDSNRQRRQQGEPAISNYQALCRQLTSVGPFGELSVTGARSVLRQLSIGEGGWVAFADDSVPEWVHVRVRENGHGRLVICELYLAREQRVDSAALRALPADGWPGVAIGPDKAGSGTNALALRPRGLVGTRVVPDPS